MDSNITKAVIKAATAAKADKNAEDYYKDGVLVCGKCHTNKEKKIQLAGECVTVRCICKCESEERERIQKQKDYEEEMRRIERLKVASLMDAKLKSATLKTFTQKEDNQKLYTIVKNYVDNFETFYKSNRGLLFWGTVGTGKSYAAACIANELLNRKIPVVMTSFGMISEVAENDGTPVVNSQPVVSGSELSTISIPVKGENGDITLEVTPEEVQTVFSLLQMTANEGITAIGKVESDNVLILVHAVDTRKTIQNAAKERADILSSADDGKNAPNGNGEATKGSENDTKTE